MASFFNYFLADCLRLGYERPSVWTEADTQRYPEWLSDIVQYNEKLPHELHPAVKELEDLIDNNMQIKVLAHGMCDELVLKANQNPSSVEIRAIRTPNDLIQLFNYMLRVPPLWNSHVFTLGLEACPYYMILNDFIMTECGFAFFLDPKVNVILAKIMNAWGDFLKSPASATCLDEKDIDWFGPGALAQLTTGGNLYNQNHTFEELYECNPLAPRRGFNSWDDFFTRRFRPGIRPVSSPDDDTIIVNACESQPFRVSTNVKYQDRFWAKGGAYSLKEMLACDSLSPSFAGGTVYQAFLSALTYHRWNSPVSGTISHTLLVPGTYFSTPGKNGFGPSTGGRVRPDDPNWQQPYISATATRAVIFITADNPAIGLMAVILIGMGEVSSCDVHATPGQRVRKGDELGTFHFGGSSHCLVFGPSVRLSGFPDPMATEGNLPVNGFLARVEPQRSDVQGGMVVPNKYGI